MVEREIGILKSIEEEDILFETVTGKQSISKLYSNTILQIRPSIPIFDEEDVPSDKPG